MSRFIRDFLKASLGLTSAIFFGDNPPGPGGSGWSHQAWSFKGRAAGRAMRHQRNLSIIP
jgi:hypothetical protein